MNGMRQGWLVASREIRERSRSKAFWAGIVITLAVVIAAIAIPAMMQTGKVTRDVGFAGTIPVTLPGAVVDQGRAVDVTVRPHQYGAAVAGEKALRDRGVAVLVVDSHTLTWLGKPDERLRAIVTGAIQLVAIRQRAAATGIDPRQLQAVVAPVPVENEQLGLVAGRSPDNEAAATIMSLLLLVAIMLYGNLVLTGVTEEKSSRVVEVLLARMPARNLLAVDRETGPVQIDRKNMERIVRVNAEPEVALSEAVNNVQGRLGQIRVPQDFSVGFGSEVEEQAKSFNQLKIVLILAVLLVYAVMASQYESLRDPFIIMFSIPTASIGIVGGLLLTRTAFSMQAYIGVIMLAGIVVSNAILLVDYINTLRRRDGMALREAVEIGGRTRLRPVLMTSIATMLGLVPMAIGIGDGGELQAPLARVVIGGLLASTMVTLVLVPAVYTLFEEGWKGLVHKHEA